MPSAHRVRSVLFLSVNVGTGKVFQPSVLEYLYRVSSLPQTVAIQTKCKREAISARFHNGASYRAKARLLTIVPRGKYPTGKYPRVSDETLGTIVIASFPFWRTSPNL